MPQQTIANAIRRGASASGENDGFAPVYVDTDDNQLKIAPEGAGTAERRIVLGVEHSEIVTAANIITADESGKTFYLDLAVGFLSTLPPPALGLWYRFVVKTAPAGGAGYTIGTNGGANIIYGLTSGGLTVFASAADLLTFVTDEAGVGNYVDLRSDGTNWYLSGMVDGAFASDPFTATAS